MFVENTRCKQTSTKFYCATICQLWGTFRCVDVTPPFFLDRVGSITRAGRMSSGAVPQPPPYRKRDHASLLIATESATGGHEYIEERDQEEYYYVHSRPQSEASESATINFLTDDRLEPPQNGDPYEEFEEIRHERHTREQHVSHGYRDRPTVEPVSASGVLYFWNFRLHKCHF